MPLISGSFQIDPFIRNSVGVHNAMGAFNRQQFKEPNGNQYAAYASSGTCLYTTGGVFNSSYSSPLYKSGASVVPTSRKACFLIRY